MLTFKIVGDPSEKIAAMKEMAERELGLIFEGDAIKGTFRARGTSGSYQVVGDELRVDIHKKPIWVPTAAIRAQITIALNR